jgi:hypothetical protein
MEPDIPGLDLSKIRRVWAARRAAIEEVKRRLDPRGLTRPPRDPEERQWLAERGELGPSIEVEEHAAEYRAYFAARYRAKT